MGKITDIIKNLRKMKDEKLFNRFKHIVRAQAIREYLNTKEDKNLTFEVRLAGEEIVKRMRTKLK